LRAEKEFVGLVAAEEIVPRETGRDGVPNGEGMQAEANRYLGEGKIASANIEEA
jgi:hypothetical protein